MSKTDKFFNEKVLGHPTALFVLFFTEMWERFSYYGMRAILVIFLLKAWSWDEPQAMVLLGTYAMFAYLTPMIGGWYADKKIGYRQAVFIGALLMTLGHASLAFETPIAFYIGLTLLVIGNGLFKPNITSIISKIYEGRDKSKDGAYNIFYMGVNSGAFLGILLCGWIGERIHWSLGFGLAGIFMLLGMLQFFYAKPIFGEIGDAPKKSNDEIKIKEKAKETLNPFLPIDYLLIFISVSTSLVFIINDPLSKIGGIDILNFKFFGMENSLFFALIAFISFLVLLMIRIPRYTIIVRDRMIVFAIFCVFTMFFFAIFEQAAGSLQVYTDKFTNRFLTGDSAFIFKMVDFIVSVVPMLIITYILINLIKKTYSKIPVSNIVLSISFILIWGIIIFKIYSEFQSNETKVPISWFAILNSMFIIIFAPLFAKWWDSKYNPAASVKYFLGLTLLGIGYGLLAYATRNIPAGANSASLSMMWLVLAYLFHTLGELCLSPVGLSYLSKLIPARMIAFMFGMFYLSIAIGNKLAHYIGGDIKIIAQEHGLSSFFLIFTIVPIVLGVLALILHPYIKKSMHGIR